MPWKAARAVPAFHGHGFRGIFPRAVLQGHRRAFEFAFSIMAGWATLAVYYSLPPLSDLSSRSLFAVGSLAVLASGYAPSRGARLVFLATFTIVQVWWLLIHRRTQGTPKGSRRGYLLPGPRSGKGDHHGIRNVDYRTGTDYTVRHYDRTFPTWQRMKSVDLFVVYWGSPLIAHTMLSLVLPGGRLRLFLHRDAQVIENTLP